jgi:hypothetical protein
VIYIIAHNKINFSNFYVDETFDKSMYGFFLTKGKDSTSSDAIVTKIKDEGFDVDLEWKLDIYNEKLQNQSFHAPTVFYHTYINDFEYKDNFIGFLEYDLVLNEGTTKEYKELISKHQGESFMIFPSIRHKLSRLDKQRSITAYDKHWLRFFLGDYNKRFNTKIEYNKFLIENGNCLIPTQQSFICDIDTYKKLSKYVYDIITEFPEREKYVPRPSTNLERFIGLYLFIESLSMKNVYELPLQHKHSSGGVY